MIVIICICKPFDTAWRSNAIYKKIASNNFAQMPASVLAPRKGSLSMMRPAEYSLLNINESSFASKKGL